MVDRSRRMEGRQAGLVDLFTVGETAVVLGVTRKQVYEWIERGVLPSIRLGLGRQKIRIRCEDLERFVEEDFVASVPPGHGGSLRQDLEE